MLGRLAAMIKIDLHIHTGEDPHDGLRYPATALLQRAGALGFGAVAITLHGKVLEDERLFAFAREQGVLLIPAVEWQIQGRDVLLYNVTQREVDGLRSFTELRAWRREHGEDRLVIAPHPYYPIHNALRSHLERNLDLFDAIEYAQVHLPWINHSQRALRIARRHNKPILANSDAHNLWMFGRHYTLVEAEPTIPAIFRAIRENRLHWKSPHISVTECLRLFVLEPLFERRRGETVTSFP